MKLRRRELVYVSRNYKFRRNRRYFKSFLNFLACPARNVEGDTFPVTVRNTFGRKKDNERRRIRAEQDRGWSVHDPFPDR